MLLTKFSHDVWKTYVFLYLQGNHRHSISDFSNITEAIHLSLQHPKITGTVGWSLVGKEWPLMKAPKAPEAQNHSLELWGVCCK